MNAWLIDVPQQSALWHNWRRHGIGGSDIPTILGLSPYPDSTLRRLALQKSGIEKPTELLNYAARRGQLLEPVARKMLADRLDVNIYVGCFEHKTNRHHRASLDGYFHYGMANLCHCVEIKALKHAIHLQFGAVVDGEAPVHSLPLHLLVQAQWQLYVSGADCCHLCSFSKKVGEERQLHVVRLYPEPVLWGGWITPPVDAFWDRVQYLKQYPQELDTIFPEEDNAVSDVPEAIHPT